METDLNLLKEAVEKEYEPLEYRACQIARYYENIRRSFFDDYYNCLNIKGDKRESKAFPYFYKLAQLENLNKDLFPDMSLYIRAQFEITKRKAVVAENFVPLAPHCLLGDNAMERYKLYIKDLRAAENYHNSDTPRPEDSVITKAIGKTTVFCVRTYQDMFGTPDIDWPKFMNHTNDGDIMPLFVLLIMNGFISKYFLSVSKTYPDFRKALLPDIKDECPSYMELQPYRRNIMTSKRAESFVKEALGSEFIFS